MTFVKKYLCLSGKAITNVHLHAVLSGIGRKLLNVMRHDGYVTKRIRCHESVRSATSNL